MIEIDKNIERRPAKDFYPLGFLGMVLFIPMFVFRQVGIVDFWWWMSLNLVLLVTLALFRDPSFRKELVADRFLQPRRKMLLGVVSAVALYLVFLVGNLVVRTVFDFAGQDIQQVYGFKGGAEAWRIAVLMLLFIGPGEELFWRGFIQGNLTSLFGKKSGFWLGVLIYTIIHIATGNLILVLAALTGGIFWGWLYLRYRSMVLNMVSHILWDIGIFLLLPIGS